MDTRKQTTITITETEGQGISYSIKTPGRREIKLKFETVEAFIFYLKRTIAVMENANNKQAGGQIERLN